MHTTGKKSAKMAIFCSKNCACNTDINLTDVRGSSLLRRQRNLKQYLLGVVLGQDIWPGGNYTVPITRYWKEKGSGREYGPSEFLKSLPSKNGKMLFKKIPNRSVSSGTDVNVCTLQHATYPEAGDTDDQQCHERTLSQSSTLFSFRIMWIPLPFYDSHVMRKTPERANATVVGRHPRRRFDSSFPSSPNASLLIDPTSVSAFEDDLRPWYRTTPQPACDGNHCCCCCFLKPSTQTISARIFQQNAQYFQSDARGSEAFIGWTWRHARARPSS